MNPQDSSYPSPDDLVAMRAQEDPVRYICDKLKVTEMGPADHIRTKHEVKAFVESGERTAAEEIVQRSQVRRTEAQVRAIRQAQQQQQGLSMSE